MKTVRDQHLLILGLGRSGKAAAELALHAGAASVTVLDAAESEALRERAERLRARGVRVELDWPHARWRDGADLVVISPGIPATSTLGQLAAGVGCPVVGELEFGFRFCACPILAVTGTNGKTTTVELTVHCLKQAGKRVVGAGNLGTPLAEVAPRSGNLDCIVVEVSSFQLETAPTLAPSAAAFLNLTSDHWDRYDSPEDYLRTKLRIFAHLADSRRAVVGVPLLAEPVVRDLPLFRANPPVTFAVDGEAADYFLAPDGWLCRQDGDDRRELVHRNDLRLIGRHNAANVLAALALCRLAGADETAAAAGARSFLPSKHRLELVTVRNGVRVVNDSKATNPDALQRALEACAESAGNGHPTVHLVAGGRDKQMDFESVTATIKQYVKEVYLIGESRQRMAAAWGTAVPCMQFASLAASVEAAVANARPGETILLSPACASQDMFRDYAERGDQFTQDIKRRLGE